jgi:hypothetical protein
MHQRRKLIDRVRSGSALICLGEVALKHRHMAVRIAELATAGTSDTLNHS